MKRIPFLLVVLAVLLAACSPAVTSAPVDEAPASTDAPADTGGNDTSAGNPAPAGPLALTSRAFVNESNIPVQYGEVNFSQAVDGGGSFVCTNGAESVNLSPALEWTNVPAGTESLVLLMWDQMNYTYPDMPEDAIFAHWVVYNIPPDATGLAEGQPADATLSDGSLQGLNNYPAPYDSGYGGPCPGAETHQYVFTLYALDTMLDLPAGADLQTVQAALVGHILAQAELKGFYTGE